MEDVRSQENSTITDGSLANSDVPAAEDNEGSKDPTSCQDLELFSCQHCGEAFAEEEAYLSHRQHHPDGKCTMYLGPMDDSDEAVKDEESETSCRLCTVSFDDMNEFRSHMETHRAESSDTGKLSGPSKQNSYECPDCGKRYRLLGHYLNHQRTHIQAPKSLFTDLQQIQKKSFKCEICGRNYSRASALDAHRRGHEEKLFKRRFRTSERETVNDDGGVTKGGKRQSGGGLEKSFKCVCGKSFTSMMGLKTHQRFSQDFKCFAQERNGKLRKNVFYCRECKKVFHGHIAWFNHEKWHEHHKKDSPKRYSCETCGKVFMTHTFYYKHLRVAHSAEAPAKSFLKQVDQLQKKAFECSSCGLKFSRLSALHSHELQHTNSFDETNKLVKKQVSPLAEKKTLEREYEVPPENAFPDAMTEGDPDEMDADEDGMECYDPGDFNVLVISGSESEDEAVLDLKPNLDSGCVSDHEGGDNQRDGKVISKPSEFDLKIVQVDFESSKERQTPPPADDECIDSEDQFDCPECYRWFTSEASLRSHLVWHKYRKRRLLIKAHHSKLAQDTTTTTLAGEAQMDNLDFDEEEMIKSEKDFQTSPDGLDANSSLHNLGSLKYAYRCSTCGKSYRYLLSFRKHLEQHDRMTSPNSQTKYSCPICGKSFYRETRLRGHMLSHMSGDVHRCDPCNKSFDHISLWLDHEEFHKSRPFWCLSCSKGFVQQDCLSRHLQKNHLGKYKCNVCCRRFLTAPLLSNHLATCRAPSRAGVGQAKLAVGFGDESVTEDTQVEEEGEVQAGGEKEGCLQKSGHLDQSEELSKKEEGVGLDASHCEGLEEQTPKPLAMPAVEEDGNAEEAKEGDGSEPLEKIQHVEQGWEFECFECGVGFGELPQLHLHYVKHGTGEIPFPDEEV
ncbi:uncharacterized protein LOC144199420 isoform X2 [Stigmatopora nigra]